MWGCGWRQFSYLTHTTYLSTTIPTAISIAVGTLQCVESARRAGDFYPTREAMFVDGIGTLIASLFGSILEMTSKYNISMFRYIVMNIYLEIHEKVKDEILILNFHPSKKSSINEVLYSALIVHPALNKKVGAQQSYCLANGLTFFIFICFWYKWFSSFNHCHCFSQSNYCRSILETFFVFKFHIYIEFDIYWSCYLFDTLSITSRHHYPAFLFGLMPIGQKVK